MSRLEDAVAAGRFLVTAELLTVNAGGLDAVRERFAPYEDWVDAVNATDNSGLAPSCAIATVASNEPVSGLGSADKSPDWQFQPNSLLVNLRAERADYGTGRVYTITVGCSDTTGNRSTKTATVLVPHDQSKK